MTPASETLGRAASSEGVAAGGTGGEGARKDEAGVGKGAAATRTAGDAGGAHKVPRRWPLVLIGVGKLMKSSGLVVAAFLLKRLLSEPQHQQIEEWLNNARLEPHNYLIKGVLDMVEKSLGLQHDTLQWLHLGVIIYAGLYLIEGVGLLWEKKWAEWMVIVTTAGFLPFEVFELWKEITWGRCLLFTLNIAAMVYLCWRLRRTAQIHREVAASGMVATK